MWAVGGPLTTGHARLWLWLWLWPAAAQWQQQHEALEDCRNFTLHGEAEAVHKGQREAAAAHPSSAPRGSFRGTFQFSAPAGSHTAP